MKHAKQLRDTALWQAYREKASAEGERALWVEKVYDASAAYLSDVRRAFINYTLHDETHVLNVLDAMAGLLGDQISRLTAGELELLILAACMHDLGMVYTDEERQSWLENETECGQFAREYCPELLGCPAEDWPEGTRQWYLRTLHPFRLPEVLQNREWKALMAQRPLEVVSLRCILAVCRAHGEEPESLRGNGDLAYQAASETDPLFCALLLRLADLLDFDDTRAPRVLYDYVTGNKKSREEWDKHQASAGFCYPATPSSEKLPYKARCGNPTIEHTVRGFLDWVDEELGNCNMLQRYCKAQWQQQFPFPREVSRAEIESDGFKSGDFCLTMDQEQLLKLLMGENLYDNRDVFVRELLQNAIDATLLRGSMDRDFVPEESRIDFWEWSDREGNLWLRVDDQGTGMTLGMLQRYFLKVGNSYYTSQELRRDLRDHGQTGNFQGISRFGIGFLSCFLCGDYAEVSTLYFDPQKNRREESAGGTSRMASYGLRLQVTGLKGYYTLKSQAEGHPAEGPLPMPEAAGEAGYSGQERLGYRLKPGTSVVVRLNPGRLGVLDLRKTLERYLCGARVPVYYNNRRIGKTCREVMEAAHEMAGEQIYELSPELKREFDDTFPYIKGQYPQVVVRVIPLDTEDSQPIAGLSGVLVKYEVRYEWEPEWEAKDQRYEVLTRIGDSGTALTVELLGQNKNRELFSYRNEEMTDYIFWPRLIEKYGSARITSLEEAFGGFSSCPQTMEELGEAWQPFAEDMDIYAAWKTYCDAQNERAFEFNIADCGCPGLDIGRSQAPTLGAVFAYQGVVADGREEVYSSYHQAIGGRAIFFLEGECKPAVEVSRSKIAGLPLRTLIAICGVSHKYGLAPVIKHVLEDICWRDATLQEWRQAREMPLGQWMSRYEGEYFGSYTKELLEGREKAEHHMQPSVVLSSPHTYRILDQYHRAYLQDSYSMTICYEEGQVIAFQDKAGEEQGMYDIFPPMMFCRAASERSRRYLCHADSYERRGITSDHPFAVWLLDNAVRLNRYFQRQLGQLIECLRVEDADEIVEECEAVRGQLLSLTDRHGVDAGAMPRLSKDDFWSEWTEEDA